MSKESLLKEITRYGFATNELVLFLDTHPHDKKALDMYDAVSEKLNALMAEYEVEYGALSPSRVDVDDRWTWIDSPWPWEN